MQLIILALVGAAAGYAVWANPGWQAAIGAAATQVVRPIVIPLVDLINAPAFVYVVSTLLVLSAIVVSVLYEWRVVRPRMRRMRRVQSALRNLPTPGLATLPAGEAMRHLGDALRGEALFPTAWAAFQGEASRQGLIPDTPFASFAAQDPTSEEAERRGLMQALPGFFTSVGLILTFIGLVVALYFAARGFRSGNMEEARAAILQLLNASSFKFLTSVAALMGALLISLVLRLGLSRMRRAAEETIGDIEGYISAWRDLQGSVPQRSPFAEVTERLDVLIAAVTGLTQRLDALAPAAGARGVDRDAAA
jgi:hypothetical protein